MSAIVPAEATRFLMALGQGLATANLYSGDHPAREKATDVLFNELSALLELTPNPKFSFLGEEVIYGRTAIRTLRDWSLGGRLSKAGVEWLEFDESVRRTDVKGFVEDVAAILSAPAGVPIDPLLFQRPGIRWGAVAIKTATTSRVSEPRGQYTVAASAAEVANTGFVEEAETTRWIATSLEGGKSIPLAEAQAVIRSLAVALHQDRDVLQPLFRLGTSPDPTTHTIGVAILTMAFAENLGMRDDEVRATGIAALLHDIGLSRVPAEILEKRERLTNDEEVEYRKHTEYGARMILDSDKDLALAALVAYEHHIAPDGSGYPHLRFPRDTHKVSKMVAICSTYHDRRSNKPFRPAMDGRAVLNHIEWYAGTKYDAQLSIAFVAMMQEAMERQEATH